jgi:hypothetical protein
MDGVREDTSDFFKLLFWRPFVFIWILQLVEIVIVVFSLFCLMKVFLFTFDGFFLLYLDIIVSILCGY